MDITLLNTLMSAGGVSGLILFGGWQLLRRAMDTLTQSLATLNQLQQERTLSLERKLDACEKKHDEANNQIASLREDCGLLKGRVQALELMSELGFRRADRGMSS